MIALPLSNLDQSSDAIQTSLLYPTNQPTLTSLTYKKSKEGQCPNMDDLGEYKIRQAKTNLGTKETDSDQTKALGSPSSHTTDFH